MLNTELVSKQALESITNYYSHLKMTGYMKYSNVFKLFGLLITDLFLNSDFRAFISEDDYKIIGKFIQCITGNCLIPYIQFLNDPAEIGTILPKYSGQTPFRLTEASNIRYSESSDARVTEYKTKYWSQ